MTSTSPTSSRTSGATGGSDHRHVRGAAPFTAEEGALIAELIARDAECYDPTISEETVRLASQFARDLGLLSRPVDYEDIVARSSQASGAGNQRQSAGFAERCSTIA